MQLLFNDYRRGCGLATDLVNTAGRVRQEGGEALVDRASLSVFLDRYELGRRPVAEDLTPMLELRAEVRSILEASDEDDVVAGASALVTRSGRGPVLERDADGTWQWSVATAPHASLAGEVAVAIGIGLLGALRALGRERLRGCAAADCDGMFVDTSRAGRRRYCTPEVCGNRQNVANFRARRRSGNSEM